MTRILAALALAFMAASASPAVAETACPTHYLDGRPPEVTTPLPQRGVSSDLRAPSPAEGEGVELCNSAFATFWSPRTRDPVYSAEVLTSAGLQAASIVPRGNDFRPDERLPASQRAILRDYRGQRTYDRGHMAPAHDMPDAAAESESFRLSNMVPQVAANNRGSWVGIEESVRTLAVPRFNGGKVYVVSGPIFDGVPKLLKGRVAIPTRLFKAVYAPDDGQGNDLVVGAWIVDNAAVPRTRFVSLEVLKAEAGVDAFPSLPADLRARAELPAGARKRTGG